MSDALFLVAIMDDVSLLIVERGKQLSVFSFWRVLAHRAEWKVGVGVVDLLGIFDVHLQQVFLRFLGVLAVG